MKDKPVIFLDMDGVCTDFFKQALKAFDMPYPPTTWPTNLSLAHDYFKLSISDFWNNLQTKDPQFWIDMEPYSWFKDLYEGLSELAPVYYLTAPTLTPDSLHGKLLWLQKQHGFHFRNYIITAHKHFLAKPHHILIDDTPEKIDHFNEFGGRGILFQQPWNTKNPPENPHLLAIAEAKRILAEIQKD